MPLTKTNHPQSLVRAVDDLLRPQARTDHLSGTQKAAINLAGVSFGPKGVDLPLSQPARTGADGFEPRTGLLRLIDRPTMLGRG